VDTPGKLKSLRLLTNTIDSYGHRLKFTVFNALGRRREDDLPVMRIRMITRHGNSMYRG
jgi:hypothetical protein